MKRNNPTQHYSATSTMRGGTAVFGGIALGNAAAAGVSDLFL